MITICIGSHHGVYFVEVQMPFDARTWVEQAVLDDSHVDNHKVVCRVHVSSDYAVRIPLKETCILDDARQVAQRLKQRMGVEIIRI